MAAPVVHEQTAATVQPERQQPEPGPLSKEDFKQQVASAMTIFLGTSKALHERGDDIDPAKRKELTAMLVRKAEELQGLLAPVVSRL